MNSSVAGYEFLIRMFFLIVSDSCRCSSVPNFIVKSLENYWHIICYLFFVPIQISWPKFQIYNVILYFYFNCSQMKRHYVLQHVQVFLRFSLHIYFCRNFSLSVMGCVPFILHLLYWSVVIVLVRVCFLLPGLCCIGCFVSVLFIRAI
jgi:hypothetical protein